MNAQKHIVTILGARPQFVKAAVVSRAISKTPGLRETIIHTGQHSDNNMSDIFFGELSIQPPAYNLGISGLTHGAMTGRMLEGIEKILMDLKPDVVMVYGDTDSTMAGALAAVKLHIPVAHVESGLRSFNRQMPEEINRVVTDHVSDRLFAPADLAVRNLKNEGVDERKIFQVGDVMYDAVLCYADIAARRSTVLEDHNLVAGKYFLATIHRPQNTDTPEALTRICDILSEIGKSHTVVLPVHPRMAKHLLAFGLQLNNVVTLPPVGYLDMLQLERHAALIVTDSGGVQKEAYFHRVPCVTLRSETEWVELVETGWNLLMQPEGNSIEIAGRIIAQSQTKGSDISLYGDGNAAWKIAQNLNTENF